MENINQYQAVKMELKRRRESIKYFNKETFKTILSDRTEARKIWKNGGDVQSFYASSATSKTDFYNKNGGVYCVMLEILNDMRKILDEN